MTTPSAGSGDPRGLDAARRAIRGWFDVALSAVDPEVAVRGALERCGPSLRIGPHTIDAAERVIIVGLGKASIPMAAAAEAALGDLLSGGVIVTKDGHRGERASRRIEILEAAHPVPDRRSLLAGERLLETVGAAVPGDIVIALVSGGGSSLAEAPRPPLTLGDLARTTDILLRAGATIGQLNAVRRPLSRIKAGGLLAACPVPLISLILSDVIGDDPGTIASGATVPGPAVATQAVGAIAVLTGLGVSDRVPPAVPEVLRALAGIDGTASSVGPLVPVFVGDNRRAVEALAGAARDGGLATETPTEWRDREGEAADLGRAFARYCLASDRDVVIGGGEATVTVRGAGVGGRNTEFALAAATALADAGDRGWVVASLATDGQDGPTGMAGAIGDGGLPARAEANGVAAGDALRDNDSLAVFVAGGGLVETGPTGTNVNDLFVGVRVAALDGRTGGREPA